MSLISRVFADLWRARETGQASAQALSAEGARAMQAGRHAAAMEAFEKALARDPDCVSAHTGLGLLCEREGNLERALGHLRRAVGDSVGERGACLLAARLMWRTGRLLEAETLLQRLTAEYPDDARPVMTLLEVLLAQERMDDAVALLERRLASHPDEAEAQERLARLYRDCGFIDKARAAFGRVAELRPRAASAGASLLFLELFREHDRAAHFERHLEWGRRFAAGDPGWSGDKPVPERRLRIGYVSADLNLSSALNFIEPLLANRTPGRFEVVCYLSSKKEDRATARMQALADGWHNVARLDDDAFCDRVRADGIDILVDLNGHTSGNRLTAFARRPAPVQASYLGYGPTTGVPAIDWKLTDAQIDPPGSESYYVERLLRLPTCMWCFVPGSDAPEVAPLPAAGSGQLTFASFNQAPKLSERILGAWGRILARVPRSRLMVVGIPPGAARRRITAALAACGVAEERVTLVGRVNFPRYLALHAEADIALDAYPYCGGATTCNALWMGVPVLTLAGRETMARSGASLLGAVEMADWVANEEDEYVDKACAFAGRGDELAGIRAGLRERVRGSALCDAARFMQNVEAGYHEMWRDWCARSARPAGTMQ